MPASGKCPGISGYVDRNKFYGDRDELVAFM